MDLNFKSGLKFFIVFAIISQITGQVSCLVIMQSTVPGTNSSTIYPTTGESTSAPSSTPSPTPTTAPSSTLSTSASTTASSVPSSTEATTPSTTSSVAPSSSSSAAPSSSSSVTPSSSSSSTPSSNTNSTTTELPAKYTLNGQLANILNVVFKWVDHHYPLCVKILKVSKTMSDTNLEQIPGVKLFLEIVAEAVAWHKTKERLETGPDFKNITIEMAIEEFAKHHNFSVKDVPILHEAAQQLTSIPAVKDLVKSALTTNIDGVPFALTLVMLIQHIGTNIPVGQFANVTVLEDLGKNISKEVGPFINIQFNKTIIKAKNHTRMVIMNITEFNDRQIRKVGDIVRNISDIFFNNLRNVSGQISSYTENNVNRTKILASVIRNLTSDQIDDLRDFFTKLKSIPGKVFDSPTNGAAHLADDTMKMKLATFNKLVNLTGEMQKLTWSHAKDIGKFGTGARDLAINNLRAATHLNMGVIEHAYDSMLNLTNITQNIIPIELFFNKTWFNVPKNKTDKDKRFLIDFPIIGSIPGVSMVQSIINRFPQLTILNFDELFKKLNIFKTKD